MKNTFGNNISVTLFGESHGEAIGAVLDGIPAGVEVDLEFIRKQLDLRRPVGKISTPRSEADKFQLVSGCFNGKTTGTPICIVIPNENTHSKDYSSSYGKARPGHADYTAFCKYNGCEDYRGGGHFSGRITAGLVAAGLNTTRWYDHLIGAAAGAIVFLAIYFGSILIIKREGLGFGDVKLAAAAGLLLGWQKFLLAMLIASVVGSIVLLVLRAVRKDEQGREYPFAPFIVAGMLFALFFGDPVINWYLGLILG